MINPDLYPLCAAGVTLVLFLLWLWWPSRSKKKSPGEWPDDIEYR